MPSKRDLRNQAVTGIAFGIGFSIGSLIFNVTLQGILYGIYRVLGLAR